MQKRGQVTIFIIIGIIILFVIGLVLFLVYPASKEKVIPEDFNEVQGYVDSCLEQTLRDGVVYLGEGPHSDYNSALAGYIKKYLVYCPNFTADFPDLMIKPKDISSVDVSLPSDKSFVRAEVVYPILVSRGSVVRTFDRFSADYSLVKSGCASVPVDSLCRYTGSVPVEVKISGLTFNFKNGDFVGGGGTCIAC